jgi:hypothetical protein
MDRQKKENFFMRTLDFWLGIGAPTKIGWYLCLKGGLARGAQIPRYIRPRSPWRYGPIREGIHCRAKRLRRRNPKTGERRSLRSIAAELAKLGYVNVNGRPFAAESIQAMIRQR